MGESKNKHQDPFADYLWMENMDDFDRQVEEQFLEEEFIRACIEQLLEEEDERETLTATEIIAQQQLQNMQGKDSAQNGPSQSSFRNGFQGNTAYSQGFTNGYSNHDYNTVVSSRIASHLNDSLICASSRGHAHPRVVVYTLYNTKDKSFTSAFCKISHILWSNLTRVMSCRGCVKTRYAKLDIIVPRSLCLACSAEKKLINMSYIFIDKFSQFQAFVCARI